MKGPHLERTASLITVPPASGKFFLQVGDRPGSSAMPGRLDNRDREGQSAMSPAQLQGSTSSPNSPENRTPPILKNYYRQKRRQQLNINGYDDGSLDIATRVILVT